MSKKITMTKGQAVKEHKELVKTLEHPTKSGLAKEAKEQGKELKEYKKK
jgi:hypothetical protein